VFAGALARMNVSEGRALWGIHTLTDVPVMPMWILSFVKFCMVPSLCKGVSTNRPTRIRANLS
jgi:hypothetical protein